ncbi:MAG: MFS transporter [Chloroflexi bacterium]|nr:MFS transporter [Chloroflexota bacterium]
MPAQVVVLLPGPVGGAPQALFLGVLSGIGSICALVAQPAAGAVSDRTAGSYGRRRPLIVAGAAASLAGMALVAIPIGVPPFAVGFLLVMAGSNVCTAAYQALLPDRVPRDQRGEASGYMGAMTIVGSVGSIVAALLLLEGGTASAPSADAIVRGAAAFYLIAAVTVAAGVLVTLGIREEPAGPATDATRAAGSALWPGPWRERGFRWVFTARAFVMFGFALFLTFIEYYLAQVRGTSDFVGATSQVALLALAGAVVSAVTLGVLSDRARRVPVVVVSSGLMAAAALAFTAAPSTIPLAPLGLVFGIGYGGYMSVDWALAIDALPSQGSVATDLGLWNIASAFPSAAAPLIGGAIVAFAEGASGVAFGYRSVFALAAVSLVLGSAAVLRVPEGALRPRAV